MASEQDKPDTGEGAASAVSEGQAQIASKNTATNQLMVKQTETQTNQNQMDKTIDGKKLVGVTLLTGFLGSGKTTFLNYILKEKHGKRIAVIENEFGDEKGIEKLIAKNTQDGDAVVDLDGLFVELSNGCICCAVKDDLVTTLEGLLERSDKFDYIFIETTGVADPGPLVGAFWLDQELESRIYLDAVVTVVDLKNLQKNLDDPRKQNDEYVNEAQKQIAYADIVIMNKRDLVDEQEFQKVQGRVQTINPFAKYLVSSYSVVKVDEILDFRGYDAIEDYSPSKMQEELLALEAKASQKDVSEDSKEHDHESNDNHGHGHKHSHDKGEGECEQCSTLSTSKHDPTVHSVVVRTPVPLVKRKLERWIGSLLWNTEDDEEAAEYVQNKPEFFRIKGVVNIADSNHVCVIQGVHETFELEESPEQWGQGEFENRFTRVVFIGRYLDVEKLRQQMEACN